ncbi:Acg family FMN-binding oxidoreductase [Streptomyces sudanensis]|uniref:Acg family FMN-binding oxidoreductase n=1 Tax=Streptomyces sudanensis TaxID=436397 RepID=UPI0020CE6D0B|nr:nitroreductase [Streptomyces sudanensis]MCP9989075.1 nitroreductase [Streptomyces sudanensis]MCP9999541.1 nitroreductase [Streptomyces sudanensis]
MTAPTPDATSLTSWVADATLAPSMHNAQPWLFRYERAPGVLTLRMDPERAMPRSDPSARGLHLGCGAALFNLRVAAADAGWEARIDARPDPGDPGLLARVAFAPAPGRDAVADLRPAVPLRHTSREPFREEAVPAEILDGLRGAARAEGAYLDFADDWRVRDLLTAVWDAERAEELAPEVREEIARWTAGRGDTAPEGIPSYALGPSRYDGRAPVRDFPGARPDRDAPPAVYESRPCLAVLGTRRDGPEDWLLAGQAMERVLLQATQDGLSTSLSSQALEWPELRWLARDPRSQAAHPQIVIRLGYGPEVPAVPRRPVTEVLEIR